VGGFGQGLPVHDFQEPRWRYNLNDTPSPLALLRPERCALEGTRTSHICILLSIPLPPKTSFFVPPCSVRDVLKRRRVVARESQCFIVSPEHSPARADDPTTRRPGPGPPGTSSLLHTIDGRKTLLSLRIGKEIPFAAIITRFRLIHPGRTNRPSESPAVSDP
jgi:hypothetical protein